MATDAPTAGHLLKAIGEQLVALGLMSVLLRTLIEETTKALIPETSRWLLTGALVAFVFLFVAIPVLRRSRQARRSREIPQILARREIHKNPWKVSAVIVAALFGVEVIVSGALGFSFGYLLPQVIEDEVMVGSALEVLGLYTFAIVLVVSAWAGRYVTHRIVGRELWWILGAILVYRLLSLPLNLLAGVPVEPVPWLLATAALLVAGWMGHRLGRRTKPYFTMSYIFGLLSAEDQAHLLDLAGSVALGQEREPSEGEGPESEV